MKYGSLNNSLKLSRPIISLDIETPVPAGEGEKRTDQWIYDPYRIHRKRKGKKAHGTHLLLLIISSK